VEREKMLLGGWFRRHPGSVGIGRWSGRPDSEESSWRGWLCAPNGCYPQLQICGPKEKWNLFHQQTQVRFRDGSRNRPAQELANAPQIPMSFAPSVAYGRTLNPDGNTQAALI